MHFCYLNRVEVWWVLVLITDLIENKCPASHIPISNI